MTTTPTVNPAVTLTNDQAFSLTFNGGDKDAEGFSSGATLAPPTVAVTAPDGTTDLSSEVLVGTDPAQPLTFWFKRAAAGPASVVGQVTATFANGGPVEVTPFTFSEGDLTGITEAENVVPLSAIPASVAFPTPAPVQQQTA